MWCFGAESIERQVSKRANALTLTLRDLFVLVLLFDTE